VIALIEIIDRYIRLSPGPYTESVMSELFYMKTVQVREPGRAVRYEQEKVELYAENAGNLLFPIGHTFIYFLRNIFNVFRGLNF